MKIPNSVIYTVGDVLGNWYYNHTKLNTLFGGYGFPGEPPAGNCIRKCQEWMRRANDSTDVDPLELLGLVLVEFMNLDLKDSSVWNDGVRRVSEVLAKNGLSFALNGQIVSVSSGCSVVPSLSIVSREPAYPSHSQESGSTPSGATTNYPIIVLVTVNDNETHALLDAFLGEGKVPVQITKGGVTYNELGIHGCHRIINTICEMGAGGIGASQQRTRQAIDHWKPRAIIAVGIAFGLDENKQSIGDVLVSTQIQDYELGRLNEDGTLTPRGDKPSSADTLRNRLRLTDTMKRRSHSDWPKVRFGLVLSGPKLVDNLDYRESLKALFPEAIGGEMEGVGVYVGASEAKVDWIVVKAICDWGHNKKRAEKDAWQQLAAKNAVRVLKSTLDVGSLYPHESTPTGGPHVESTTVVTRPRETLRFTFDDSLAPVGGRSALSLFMNDLSRIHARTGSMPPYEINIKGCTDIRQELEHLEENLSNNPNEQVRRFTLRQAVDKKRMNGGLPIDLYIAEALGIAARQLRPGRIVWISKHDEYVDIFMTFISIITNGWPKPSYPFDIFPLEGETTWYARTHLTKPDINMLLSAESCPSVNYLTREWGLRIMHCPIGVVQQRVIPGLLRSYLLQREIRSDQLPKEEHYFGNISSFGIGLH